MVMPYHLHMPSYFLETFTEYPYILFRHAVMVKLESYIAVPHYRCRALLLHLVAYGGKWAEVLGFNLFASGQGTSVHPAPVKG